MLWDPESNTRDGDGEGDRDNVSVTPILVPLQNKAKEAEKSVPVPVLVPDVQDLKDQFQQQQNMLTQIKETIKQNETQLTSREKQVEVYANKLSQIRARTKNPQAKKQNTSDSGTGDSKTLVKKASKENLAKLETSESKKPVVNSPKTGRRVKVSELKKCLEENKIKFEQRTGKEQTETKKIETMVEQLKTQLEERDKTIQDLQKNIEQPKALSRRTKHKSETVASKMTQTHQPQPFDESNEITNLQKKIYELEANVLDLEENLKEKESVIEARTQAVTLLSQDLSLKGKNTLENLEETRQEMRTMQNNFIAIEDQLKKDLLQRDNRLADFEEKYKKLQSTNFDLSLKNAELQEKLVKMMERYAEMEAEKKASADAATSGDQSEETLKKISTLTKELDERNKAMIKMKIEHRNKMKSLNAMLESLKGASDDKAEIFRLCKLVEELEIVKTGLENRVAELEDEKATEKNLKDQINELEIVIQRQREDLSRLEKTIETLENEKSDLIRSNRDQNALIEDLYGKLITSGDGGSGSESISLGDEVVDGDGERSRYDELKKRFNNLEAEFNRRLENLKIEHGKEIEMLESYYNNKMENSERRELEEYRISTEMNNIHVEEQIDLLIREKQQLLEKLKSLSGISSTDSLAFEKVERPDMKTEKETSVGETVNLTAVEEVENRISHLQRIVNDQQNAIGELEKSLRLEREKVNSYDVKLVEMTETLKALEDANRHLQDQINTAESVPGDLRSVPKNQKSNSNAKNKVRKLEMELSEAKKALAEQSKKLEDLNDKLKEKEDLIRKHTERIELFEKDDWDRQNHWQNSREDVEDVQELQRKCLSLENGLIELNDEFERLRKENIELVHLLSEEKVKRQKMIQDLAKKQPENSSHQLERNQLEKRIQSLAHVLEILEGKVDALEKVPQSGKSEEDYDWGKEELEQKLEWTNVVLTSKETEIFRLQNLLEDRNKAMERLEADLNDSKSKLAERENNLEGLREQNRFKEAQYQEVASKVDSLNRESVEKFAQSEAQIHELMQKMAELENSLAKKSFDVEQLQGVLQQKDADIGNLKGHVNTVTNELTKQYEDRISQLDAGFKVREANFEAVSREKTNLEAAVKDLMAERDVIRGQKEAMSKENDRLQGLVAEMREKLKAAETSVGMDASKPKPSQEMEDMKTKMKKLAANLKKKAQNEADLMKQLKDLETSVAERDQMMEALRADIHDVTEKWTSEKSEKEQVRNELANLESERSVLKEKFVNLGKELEENRLAHENQMKRLQEEIEKSSKICNEFQTIEEQYKGKVFKLEKSFNEVSAHYENTLSALKVAERELDEERKTKEEILKKLGEITGKFEETKFKHNQVLLEKTEVENRLEELERVRESSATEKTAFDAKFQENLAVIENLESELAKAQDHVKYVEEKLFVSEERRLSLESKNEEMCRKITEDSHNLMTIDDLAAKVDELLKSEKSLLDAVKNLESNNAELKQSLDEAQSVKQGLEADAKALTDKIVVLTEELKQMRDADVEKAAEITSLTKEVDKTKAENKQILGEYDKLNRDYEQFEVDFKENLETSQNIEKSLKHKIEELTVENASLLERLNSLSEDKLSVQEKAQEEKDDDPKKRKKKKSVTFRTDEVEYIKDLKQQLHAYDGNLKRANEEIESLKAELFREKVKEEVSNVVAEAENQAENLKCVSESVFSPVVEPAVERTQMKSLSAEKPETEERKFDASMFFGGGENVQGSEPSFFDVGVKLDATEEPSQSSDFDSLMWDDGWGTDGHLEDEYLTGQIGDSGLVQAQTETHSEYSEKIKSLQAEAEKLRGEVERLSKESEEQAAKYVKALKKIKEQKIICEKLQSDMGKMKKEDGFGDLNAAIMDELKSQIEGMEKKEREYLKALESHKAERETLLKKIDLLNADNEKYMEMKERQNNDVEIWQERNNELLREIAELRQNQDRSQVTVADNIVIAQQNRELLNRIEALEWKNCELTQLIEEKEEMLEEIMGKPSAGESSSRGTEEKSLLQREIEELKNVKELLEKRLSDEENKNVTAMDKLNEQLTALANENETLQDILGEMKSKGSAMNDSKIVGLRQRLLELEDSSRVKDAEIDQLKTFTMQSNEELMALRQRVFDLESEKESDNRKYRETLLDMENLLKGKEEELQRVLLERPQEKPMPASDAFETIELTRSPESSLSPSSEDLRLKILQLEDLLRLKEETLLMHSTFVQERGKEVEDLKNKIFQLEEFLRSKDEELNVFRSTMTWTQENANEVEQLRTKVRDLEEFLSFKENELYQMETVKAAEIQNLNMRIFDLENLTKGVQEGSQQTSSYDATNNVLRLREDESDRIHPDKSNRIESLEQKVVELETLLSCKREEVDDLVTKLAQLEKNYNDSKIEIERLLNEEKLNTEEKFVEPFQNNIQIPVAFELEAMSRSLDEEKQKADNLQYELSDKDKLIEEKSGQIDQLRKKLGEFEAREKMMREETGQMKAQLEKIITDLQKELDSSNLQLGETRRELEQYQNTEDETRSRLKSQILELETTLLETTEKKDSEIMELKSVLEEKTLFYESLLGSNREKETEWTEKALNWEKLEKETERLRTELESKNGEIASLSQLLIEERIRVDQMNQMLETKDAQVGDLRQTLTHMQGEIASFRNFEKQVKELRMAQLKEAGSDVSVTPEGDADLTGWTEHELAELSMKLQSDLDTALYMLHQRDVRCDELTFELMQLIEERDTLQLRLSNALRLNEELRSLGKTDNKSVSEGLQENKDLVDQSNDRQRERGVPGEDLQQLANKISQLHSISYLRDKTVKDDSVQRHAEQMTLLSRISDSDVALGRDGAQSPPTVLLNWMRGKSTPKVMHI